MAFTGNHDHTLDAKNRLTLPARFRSDLAGEVVLAKGFERCLQVMPAKLYSQLVERALAGVNPLGPEARDLQRHLYGNAIEMELDSAGRINLPQTFLGYAGITKDVVIVGSGQWLEVWDRASWQSYDTDLIGRAAEHIASVGHPA